MAVKVKRSESPPDSMEPAREPLPVGPLMSMGAPRFHCPAPAKSSGRGGADSSAVVAESSTFWPEMVAPFTTR